MHISFIIIYKSIDENVQQEITFNECPQMSKLTKYNCQCDAKISNGTEFAAISCKLIERKYYESA